MTITLWQPSLPPPGTTITTNIFSGKNVFPETVDIETDTTMLLDNSQPVVLTPVSLTGGGVWTTYDKGSTTGTGIYYPTDVSGSTYTTVLTSGSVTSLWTFTTSVVTREITEYPEFTVYATSYTLVSITTTPSASSSNTTTTLISGASFAAPSASTGASAHNGRLSTDHRGAFVAAIVAPVLAFLFIVLGMVLYLEHRRRTRKALVGSQEPKAEAEGDAHQTSETGTKDVTPGELEAPRGLHELKSGVNENSRGQNGSEREEAAHSPLPAEKQLSRTSTSIVSPQELEAPRGIYELEGDDGSGSELPG